MEIINNVDPIKEVEPDNEEVTINKQGLIDEICQAFVADEAEWETPEYGGKSSGVIYYLTAIRMIATKPFDDDDVHYAVMEFLEKKVDEASEKLMADANERIKVALTKH